MDNNVAEAIGKGIGTSIVLLVGIWLWHIAKVVCNKVLKIGKQTISKAKDRIEGTPDADGCNDALYTAAYQEMDSGNFEAASWAKAFTHASGDQEKAKALYIKYRVEQLKQS